MTSKKKSLAQELADLFNPAPTKEYDPDAVDLGDGAKLASDDEYGEARAAPSKRAPEKAMLLRGDIVLEDAAYRGRKTSRAAVFGDGGEDGGADDDKDVGLDLGDEGENEDGEQIDASSEGEEVEEAEDDDEEEDGSGERRAAAACGGPSGRGGAAVAAGAGGRTLAGKGPKAAAAKRDPVRLTGSPGRDAANKEDEDADQEEEHSEEVDEQAQANGHRPDGRSREAGLRDGASGRAGAGGDDELEALEAEYEALQEEDDQQLEALRKKGEQDREKGAAVRNQQVLYERVLEQRILLQKCLQASNGLPRPETHAALTAAKPDVHEGYAQLAAVARDTLGQLLELQSVLMARNSAIALPTASAPTAAAAAANGGDTPRGGVKRRRKGDENAGAVSDDDAGDLEALWRRVTIHHEALASFRDVSLDSWHRRTVLSSGSGAHRNAGLRALNQRISSQVAAIMRDPARFIKRTRLVLSACPRVLCEPPRAGAAAGTLDPLGSDGDGAHDTAAGKAPSASVAADLTEEERDPETYDDSEFYQQLLKEFLDKGLADGAAAAPKSTKKRKLVDRRASKGRKLRYHVQEKLVAFMAPVDFTPPPFAANLFSNLFGHAGK